MAELEVNPSVAESQPLPEPDYRGTLPPELRGEVLAQVFLARNTHWSRMEKILAKLGALLAAADALKAKGGVQ